MAEASEPTRTSAGGPPAPKPALLDLFARNAPVPGAPLPLAPTAGEASTCTGCAASGADTQGGGSPGAPAATGAEPFPRIGPYDILEKIGAGGMGVVYLARQRGLNRPVALKVIKDLGGPKDDDRIRRFLREAQAAARLAHPGIVPVFDIGQDGEVYYYSMEYVLGRSLADVIKEDRPSPRRSLEIVTAVARTLAYAHAEGVIHRDIKPPNIMLTPDGRPLIMDFGIAKDRSKESILTQEGVALGTPAYMPPEQALGQLDRVDARSDVYSLGAVFYQLLTGKPPFTGETPFEVVVKLLQQPPVPLRALAPAVHVDIETMCMKCLEKEPGRRYGSAEALADDVDRFLEGAPILARPLSPLAKLARGMRRRWLPLAAVAGFALAAAGVAWYHDRAEREGAERLRRLREAGTALDAGTLEPPERWPDTLARARAMLDGVLAGEPANREARLRRAEVALRAGEWPGAAADLDAVLAAHPADGRALYLWARLGDELREVQEESPHPALAETSAQRLAQLAAGQGDFPQRARIRLHLRAGRPEEAASSADALLASGSAADPADLRHLSLLAHVQISDLEIDELLRRAEALIRADSRRPATWRLRYRLLEGVGRDAEAAPDLETCIALQPRPAAADFKELYRLYEILHPAADAPERLRVLERMTRRYPDESGGWQWLAAFHAQAGRFDQADAALTRCASLSSRPLDAVGSFYGIRRRAQGNEAAAAFLEERLREHPPAQVVERHGGDAISDLMDSLTGEREYGRAETILRACLEVRPDDPHLIAMAADLAFEMGRNRDAVREYARVIALRPGDSEPYSKRARAQRRLGHLKEALEDMRRAVSLKGSNVKNRLQLGVLYGLNGRLPEAAEQFAEVLYRTPTLELERRLHRWAAGDFSEEDRDEAAPATTVDPERLLAVSLVQKLLPPVCHRLLRKGRAALREGDEGRAEQCFAAAGIGMQESPDPYVCMAQLQARRRSWVAATLCLERAAALGYDGFARLVEEPDFSALAEFPRVRRLIDAEVAREKK